MASLLGSEEHTSELQSPCNLVCRLLLEKKNIKTNVLRAHGTGHSARLDVACAVARLHQSPPRVLAIPRRRPVDERRHPLFFFFNDTAPTEIYTLSLHDALPI